MCGARAFGEGGYGGTPVADALPLLIDPRTRASDPAPLARLKLAPTRAGQGHAVTQIAANESASAARWSQLPQITSLNAPLREKPGATVLLNGTDERGRAHVVLASHQYGRGKAVAFTTQDSWQWQMHVDMSLEDQTHENFWRQMLRWQVDGVPDVVDVRLTDRVEPGESVTIEAAIVDPQYVELNDATVIAQVAQPGGATLNVPLQWTGERDGQYRGSFVILRRGIEVSVDATRAGGQASDGWARVPRKATRVLHPTMHAQPLQRSRGTVAF